MSEQRLSLNVAEIDGQMHVLPPAHMNVDTVYKPKTDKKAKITEGSFEENKFSSNPWAPWGIDDQLPNTIRKKIMASPMAGQTIYRMIKMMYGNGLCYYSNKEYEQTGKYRKAYNPVIEKWLRLNRVRTHLIPALFSDWLMYMNSFSEMILSGDKKKITNIYHKPAAFSRLEIQNEKTFNIDHLYYSPGYSEGYQPQVDDIKKIKLFNWVDQAGFLDTLSGNKFAWHAKFPSGDPYYTLPFWYGLIRDNGWLDVNNKVPEIINAMMDNQITLKYIIHIPYSYFNFRFHQFDQRPEVEKNRIINDFIASINAKLKGVENTFTSIASLFKENEFTQNAEGKIEIVAIDEKVKKDAWVPSADHSNAQIVQALGLHPSQMGLAPQGGKMGAGSGSDQRESYNTGISLNTIDQDINLEPLNWLAVFNAQSDPKNWDYTFYIDHTVHTTTNDVETGLLPGDNDPGVQNLQA